MATAATQTYLDADKVEAWAACSGPTDTEKIKFAEDAIDLLEDINSARAFSDNVKKVGIWANQVDASFDKATRTFGDLVVKYGREFPGFAVYNEEWINYKERWVSLFQLSRDVASELVALLRRFDQVYLDMVETIDSDQSRKDVILEFQQFINEPHDRPLEMQQGFIDLKRNIEDFIERLDQFIIDKGVKLDSLAAELKQAIAGLLGQIAVLDKKIRDATIALTAMGACVNLIGLIVSGSVLAAYHSERNDRFRELLDKQSALANVNRKQVALAYLKSYFDGVKPDTLVCEKLALFAEIWPAIRNQSINFREHMQGGMGALSNMRFKKEVRLARRICAPLQAGLEKYATELENRPHISEV